jgi:hypothetical protein
MKLFSSQLLKGHYFKEQYVNVYLDPGPTRKIYLFTLACQKIVFVYFDYYKRINLFGEFKFIFSRYLRCPVYWTTGTKSQPGPALT